MVPGHAHPDNKDGTTISALLPNKCQKKRPCLIRACFAYSEQEGMYLQDLGKVGEIEF